MPSYRAVIYRDPYTGEKTVLTGPDSAYDDEQSLIEAAVAEAHHAELIGEEPPMVPEMVLRQYLYIGTADTAAAPGRPMTPS